MIFGQKFVANLRKLSPILTVIAVISMCVCPSLPFSTTDYKELTQKMTQILCSNSVKVFKISFELEQAGTICVLATTKGQTPEHRSLSIVCPVCPFVSS